MFTASPFGNGSLAPKYYSLFRLYRIFFQYWLFGWPMLWISRPSCVDLAADGLRLGV
jgi:hypothetical protein